MTTLFPSDPPAPFPIRPGVRVDRPRPVPPPDVTLNPDQGLRAALVTLLIKAGWSGVKCAEISDHLPAHSIEALMMELNALDREGFVEVRSGPGCELIYRHALAKAPGVTDG